MFAIMWSAKLHRTVREEMPMAVADLLPSRYTALAGAIAVTVLASIAALFDSRWLFLAGAAGALSLIGVRDYVQTRHAILRNYPLLAHFRFFFEAIRPEIRQYLLEGDNEEVRFSRAQRSLVYQRAKNVESRQPFSTGEDVYRTSYEWINHSLRPVEIDDFDSRVKIGGKYCKQPYSCSVFNISAMSSARTRCAHSIGAPSSAISPTTPRRLDQPLSPRARRRSDLGNRQRLFRLPHAGWKFRPATVRAASTRAAGQNDRDQAFAGRQARPRQRVAWRESDARNRRFACHRRSIPPLQRRWN
jgi:hypothetical protein